MTKKLLSRSLPMQPQGSGNVRAWFRKRQEQKFFASFLQKRRPFFALLCAISVTACASAPTTLHLTLQAQPGLNPDNTGLPNPVQAHVFLLKNADSFSNTDYFQFADKEKTVLGGDLLAQRDQFMHPGQTQMLTIPIPKDAKFIGVSAAYRNIDQATWRVVTPVVGKATITLSADALRVQNAK